MFRKEWKSLTEDFCLEDPRADYKAAKRLGQYRISEKALYKPDGSYIPFSAVKEWVHDQTSVHVSGCCAGGVPVERIIFITDNKKFPMIFDSGKQVDIVLEILKNR